MNVGELVTAVQRQFGDDSGVQITRPDIVRWINQAGIDIARKTECVQDHKQADSVSGDGSYSLPTDFIRMRRVTFNDKVIPSTTLDIADQDWMSRDIPSGVQGTPQYYYIWNSVLYLYPKPSQSSSGNLDIYYVRTPAAVSADEDIPEIPAKYHEFIVRYCLSKAKELNDEYDVARTVKVDYESDILDVKDEIARPNSRSYNAVRLLPGDDW